MKRICPNCRTGNLERKLFSFQKFLSCSKCNKYFEDSKISRMAIVANLFMLLVVGNILTMGFDVLILVVIYILNSLVILQYLPVVPAGAIEYSMLPPTDVKFDKTDSVSENIKRYKEAQRLAIKNNIANQNSRFLFSV